MSHGRQKTYDECIASIINTFVICVASAVIITSGGYNYYEWCKSEAAIKAGLHWGMIEGSGTGFGNPAKYGWVKPKVNDSEK